MTEHPIIFSTPMVKAILEGRKTMTRRVIKPQAHHYVGDALGQPVIYPCDKNGNAEPKEINFPYGTIGDRLWVRENFVQNKFNGFDYRASYLGSQKIRWKPSIHMPRTAARIFLEVTDIRVKRVQDINDEDCLKEGIYYDELLRGYCIGEGFDKCCFHGSNPKYTFSYLWDKINGKRGYTWESNPFVWVIEFKNIRTSNRVSVYETILSR